MVPTSGVVRLAAMGDIHVGKTGHGALASTFASISERADVLAICGDLTDYGLPEEGRVLAREIATALRVPCIAVMGNHDFEAGKCDEIRQILVDAGVVVLDGDATEVAGVGFAGVKGFCGGFGRGALGPWGEDIIKLFVREAVNEAFKLESALALVEGWAGTLEPTPSAVDEVVPPGPARDALNAELRKSRRKKV